MSIRWFQNCTLVCSLVVLTSCTHGIRIIGIDKRGEKKIKIPPEKYAEEVGDNLAITHEATLKALEDIENDVPENPWELDYIMVGVGIEGQVGIAQVINLRAFPRFRLYYTKE